MKRNTTWASGLIVLAGLGLAAWQGSRAADEPQRPADKAAADKPKSEDAAPGGRDDLPLRDYMRKKLAASNQILEGLCTEDSELILEGARTLNEMSTSERWRVSNDPIYRQFSSEFRAVTQQLVEAAEKQNEDRAALKWMDATMACIDCHNFVRGMRIADADRK